MYCPKTTYKKITLIYMNDINSLKELKIILKDCLCKRHSKYSKI